MQHIHPLLETARAARCQPLDELEATIDRLGAFRDHRFNYGEVNIAGNYGFYQIPRQLAMFLFDLKEYNIKNMVNVGTFNGWTTVFIAAYLDVPCVSIDTRPENLDKSLEGCGVEFITGTSDDYAGQVFDFSFIDGSHTKKWLVKDFDNLGRHSRYCAFHDINDALCPDVVDFYQNLSRSCLWHREYNYHSNGERVMGIGLIRPDLLGTPYL
jgi:hypothetical protein